MILAVKNDFSFEISAESLELLNAHLNEKLKSSVKTMEKNRYVLLVFLNHVKRNVLDVSPRDALEYLNFLESRRDIGKSTKDQYRSDILMFFEYIEFWQRVNHNPTYRNPVPNSRIFKFSETKKTKDITKVSSFTKEQLVKLLKLAKMRNLRDYMLFQLLIKVGMRISEAVTIRIENIDFTERTIITGMEPRARKSSRHFEDKQLVFFFSRKLGLKLREYVLYLNKTSGWLFEGYKGNHLNITNGSTTILKYYHERMGFKFGFHAFRRTLITRRKKHYDGQDGRLKIADWESEIIMNHVPKTVEHKHYLKLSTAEKREIFDMYPMFEDIW